MKKVALHNLGCKVNSYEIEVVQQLLEENGYIIVPFVEKADIYIVNTCSVTNTADQKSRQMLHRARKMNPEAIVVATGCYAQTDTKGAGADNSVDLIIGNNRKKDIVAILQEYEAKRKQEQAVDEEHKLKTLWNETVLDISKETVYEEMQLVHTAEHTRAYIKVQDGCNQFCSYCIIPYARGRVRSRSSKHVLEEISNLTEHGFKEVVLTGIHLSSYGIDFEEDYRLIDLICDIHAIKGIRRIRLGSLEPRIITPSFVETLSKLWKVCPHFHLSLQSGSDTVLKRMNRHYSTSEYYEKVQLLRQYYEHPAITTDVIVGFPGETEEEFEETSAYLERIDFYETHIFKYSRRKGTKADAMPDQIKEQIKTLRSSRLIKEGNVRSLRFREYYCGKQIEILTEDLSNINGIDYRVGYTPEYVRAAFPCETGEGNQLITGRAAGMLTDEILEFSKDIE